MSHEIINQFYGSFPWFGVRFDRQILPWKDNNRATNPLVQSAFVVANPANRTQDILAYLASGQLGKRYTFRSGYDSHTDTYKVQYNTGTDAAQNWVDYLIIDADGDVSAPAGRFYGTISVTETDGSPFFNTDKLIFHSDHFYLTPDGQGDPVVNFRGSSGGGGEVNTASNVGAGTGVFAQKVAADLQFKSLVAGSNVTITSDSDEIFIASSGGGSGDFYGILIKESEAGGYSKRKDAIVFDSADFYVSTDGDGRPLVSAKTVGGSVSQAFSLSTEWQLTHNFSSKELLWATYDDRDEAVIPYRVDVSNPNTAYFYFSSAESGFALVSRGAGAPIINSVTNNNTTINNFSTGFYGITVAETDGNPAYAGVNKINFDRQYFYVNQNSPNTDEVIVSFKPVADATTASNLGTGSGLFAQKVADDLQFKSLTAGTGITLTPNATEVQIAFSGSAGGGGGGFYGVLFKESEAGGARFRNDTLIFNSDDFYLGTSGSGKPLVSLNKEFIELIASYSATDAASIDINNVFNTTKYREHILKYRLTVSVNDVEIWLRTSFDGGVTFDAGTSDYGYAGAGNLAGGAVIGVTDAADSEILISGTASSTGAVGNVAGEHASGTVFLNYLGDGTSKFLCSAISAWVAASAATGISWSSISGMRHTATAVNAVRILAESGTITGTVEVFGVPI